MIPLVTGSFTIGTHQCHAAFEARKRGVSRRRVQFRLEQTFENLAISFSYSEKQIVLYSNIVEIVPA